jgi:hypothetical protein
MNGIDFLGWWGGNDVTAKGNGMAEVTLQLAIPSCCRVPSDLWPWFPHLMSAEYHSKATALTDERTHRLS